jgi:hypothetical protein
MNMRILFYGIAVIAFLSCGPTSTSEDRNPPIKETAPSKDKSSRVLSVDPVKSFKEQLVDEIKTIDDPFDYVSASSIPMLQGYLVTFNIWRGEVNRGEKDSNDTIKKSAVTLKKKLIAKQAQELPKMRKHYAKLLAEGLWDQDVYVACTGNGNSILNITAGMFAANANIKQFQTMIADQVNEFRFKEIRYRWYKGADEFTYYKIESPADKELIASEN